MCPCGMERERQGGVKREGAEERDGERSSKSGG